MNVVTSRKVIVRNGGKPPRTSGIDGKSSPEDIKAFQSWYNKNKGGSLAVDGKWGPKTSAAWTAAGAEYDALTNNPAPKAPAEKPALEKTDEFGKKKDGHLWDKAKGVWVKAKKTGAPQSFIDSLFSKKPADEPKKPVAPGEPEQKPAPEPPKKKGNSALKLGLGLAGAALLIWGISRIVKGNKK